MLLLLLALKIVVQIFIRTALHAGETKLLYWMLLSNVVAIVFVAIVVNVAVVINVAIVGAQITNFHRKSSLVRRD